MFDAYGQLPAVREVPEPDCPAGAAVIAVRATGVCRSDWHAWRAMTPSTCHTRPGTQLAGEVVRVGAGVGRVALGDRVTVPFVCGCGRCARRGGAGPGLPG